MFLGAGNPIHNILKETGFDLNKHSINLNDFCFTISAFNFLIQTATQHHPALQLIPTVLVIHLTLRQQFYLFQ